MEIVKKQRKYKHFLSIEDQVTQNTVWAFFWIIFFSSDILSGKLTKFAGHFRNLPVLSDRPTVFAKTDLIKET